MELKWFAGVCAAGALGLLTLSSDRAKVAANPAGSDEPAVLVGAGDIADCTRQSDDATAKLIAQVSGGQLLDGTIAQNIARFDPEADPATVIAAAEKMPRGCPSSCYGIGVEHPLQPPSMLGFAD